MDKKFVSVLKIEKYGRICLGSLVDEKFLTVSVFVDMEDRIHILPVLDPENYFSGGIRCFDEKRRLCLKKFLGNAKRVYVTYGDDEGELVLWPK